MPDDKPKIIIDSDWKSQAQAEKDRLAADEAKKAAAKPAPGAPGPRGQREMPPADWQGLVGTLVTQALVYMGGFPDPKTGRAVVAPEYARFHIDLLAVLEQKTKGNLSAEEAQDLAHVVSELKMRYVEISRAIEEMAREQAAGGTPGMAPGLNINPAKPAGPGPGLAGPGKLVY
jgi:hypothetical protein